MRNSFSHEGCWQVLKHSFHQLNGLVQTQRQFEISKIICCTSLVQIQSRLSCFDWSLKMEIGWESREEARQGGQERMKTKIAHSHNTASHPSEDFMTSNPCQMSACIGCWFVANKFIKPRRGEKTRQGRQKRMKTTTTHSHITVTWNQSWSSLGVLIALIHLNSWLPILTKCLHVLLVAVDLFQTSLSKSSLKVQKAWERAWLPIHLHQLMKIIGQVFHSQQFERFQKSWERSKQNMPSDLHQLMKIIGHVFNNSHQFKRFRLGTWRVWWVQGGREAQKKKRKMMSRGNFIATRGVVQMDEPQNPAPTMRGFSEECFINLEGRKPATNLESRNWQNKAWQPNRQTNLWQPPDLTALKTACGNGNFATARASQKQKALGCWGSFNLWQKLLALLQLFGNSFKHACFENQKNSKQVFDPHMH